jgi:hypothetical protein
LRVSWKLSVLLLTNVNEPRNTNAPLSITVLCACLGLLIIGVPAEVNARQAATEVAYHYVASSTRLRLAASAVSSLQVRKADVPWHPGLAAQATGQPEVKSYQNSKALIDTNQVLLVTHLPRAALSEQPAKSLPAGLSRDEE